MVQGGFGDIVQRQQNGIGFQIGREALALQQLKPRTRQSALQTGWTSGRVTVEEHPGSVGRWQGFLNHV